MSNFPSIEDIDSGVVPSITTEIVPSTAEDFIAREAELLGDDASQFQTAPIESEYEAKDVDILDEAITSPVAVDSDAAFEKSFPPLDNTADFTTSAMFTTSSEPYMPTSATVNTITPGTESSTAISNDEIEPEPIRKWRERTAQAIAERDEESARKKEEAKEAAIKELDSFYEEYNERKQQGIAQTRSDEQQFLEEIESNLVATGGTTWGRIAKLTAQSDKKHGTAPTKARFSQVLGSLKDDARAPGIAL